MTVDSAAALRRAQQRIATRPWETRETDWNRYLGYRCKDDKDAAFLNLFGITRPAWLKVIETAFVRMRFTTMPLDIPACLDETGMKAIHAWLYQDVYPWAGELRTTKIRSDELYDGMEYAPLLWSQLERTDNMRLIPDETVPAALCDFYVRASRLGGFIQGNDMVAAVMTTRVAQAVGRGIDWTKLDNPTLTLETLAYRYRLGDKKRFQDVMWKSVSPLIESPLATLKAPHGYFTASPTHGSEPEADSEDIPDDVTAQPPRHADTNDKVQELSEQVEQLRRLVETLTSATPPTPQEPIPITGQQHSL